MQSPSPAGKNPEPKHLVRLMRALARTGHAPPRQADGGLSIEVKAGGIVRRVRFEAKLVEEAERAGFVVASAEGLRLSQVGRSHLARLDHGEIGHFAQHRPVAALPLPSENGAETALVDLAESPLAWLRRRRGGDGQALISEAAFAAGERFRAEFTRAGLAPRMTANWEAAIASGRRADPGLTQTEISLAARQRFGRALDAVGPELSGVLMDVCCFLKGLEQVEAERRWPARSAKVVLCLGLERLAVHYGYGAQASGPDRSGGIRAWAQAGSRGSIADRPARRGA